MSFRTRFLEPEEPIEYPCCIICTQPICPLDIKPNYNCPTIQEYKRKYDEFWAEKSQHLYQNWLEEQKEINFIQVKKNAKL